MKKEKYVKAAMTNWYEPRMLANIGLKAIISGTFGNYADRRELEAALDSNLDGGELEALHEEYCEGKEEIWIDVVNDTGDGFNSTFAVAKCVARKSLSFKWQNKDGTAGEMDTPRPKILIFGGDEVYPFPTIEAYTNKFKIPFTAAAETPAECDKKEDRPHLYAIPGNHDWYDGLGNFIKLFCQKRWIGIWSTKQHRSYFALPLPNNYWIWATDIQLNSDIDQPQLRYFRIIAQEKMKEGDKVILITAEPAWVYAQIVKGDRSFSKLKFFTDNYINNKDNCTGKAFKLAATLTGDLHHYARYQKKGDDNGHQYITAGGGGAFLHLTHNLPDCLKAVDAGDAYRQTIFPDKQQSKSLLLWNFIFPIKNRFFTLLLLGIYAVFFAVLHNSRPEYLSGVRAACDSAWSFWSYTGSMLLHSPGVLMLSVAIAFGFYSFADTKVVKSGSKLIGALHGLSQLVLLFYTMYAIGMWPLCGLCADAGLAAKIGLIIAICIAGALASGLLFGIYLYCSNRLLDMHINEASSSLACEDYKNFLRLHVHKDGVTIYPIGIRRVPRNWTPHETETPEGTQITFSGNEDVSTFLIEPPIKIYNDKL